MQENEIKFIKNYNDEIIVDNIVNNNAQLEQAYLQKLSISVTKRKYIQDLMEHQSSIPTAFHEFYKNIMD